MFRHAWTIHKLIIYSQALPEDLCIVYWVTPSGGFSRKIWGRGSGAEFAKYFEMAEYFPRMRYFIRKKLTTKSSLSQKRGFLENHARIKPFMS